MRSKVRKRLLGIKWWIALHVGAVLIGCAPPEPSQRTYREDFTEREQQLLAAARAIIDSAYYGTLITLRGGVPKARVMEPFRPDSAMVVWMGTHRRTRKLDEIRFYPIGTLHFFARQLPAYVSLYGRMEIVDDEQMKDSFWMPSWSAFYRTKGDYVLLRFVPDSLELIDVSRGYSGDTATWRPHVVVLRK